MSLWAAIASILGGVLAALGFGAWKKHQGKAQATKELEGARRQAAVKASVDFQKAAEEITTKVEKEAEAIEEKKVVTLSKDPTAAEINALIEDSKKDL